MSTNLRLLPYYGDGVSCNCSLAVLPLDGYIVSWKTIEELPSLEVDEGFLSYLSRDDQYEESHIGITMETAYGEPLEYTLAKHLKGLIPGPPGAFINELDDGHKVALFWH